MSFGTSTEGKLRGTSELSFTWKTVVQVKLDRYAREFWWAFVLMIVESVLIRRWLEMRMSSRFCCRWRPTSTRWSFSPTHWTSCFVSRRRTNASTSAAHWRYLSAILSLQSPSSILPITSSPFFNPTTSPCTIYVDWFWSACVQLQLSCNMELHSYLH